jgi:hypothetical protein
MPPMNRSGRVLRRIDSGAPIHEAGIALYRTVMIDREAIRQRWRLFGSKLDECGRRHAAVEARTAGHGGIVAVHEITGIARRSGVVSMSWRSRTCRKVACDVKVAVGRP